MNNAPMTLDELAGDWLRPGDEEHFSLPAIANVHGMVQAAWDVCGVQNWICAPTGLPTPTALLYFRDGRRVRRFPREAVEYRWKAYEIERRGHGVHSVVRIAAGQAGVMERIRFERELRVCLVFGGLPRVWRFTDYWNLPAWDVPQLNVTATGAGFRLTDCKTFGAAEFRVPGALDVYADAAAWLDGDAPVERGMIGVAEFPVRPGDEIVWSGVQGCEETLPEIGDVEAAWREAKSHWEDVWSAAFTPGNGEFSGHLPTYEQAVRSLGERAPELGRLYYMAVLTLLMTRRFMPAPTPRSLVATGGQCIWTPPEAHSGGEEAAAGNATCHGSTQNPESRIGHAAATAPDGRESRIETRLRWAYVWGGPEGAPTTSFLWEVEFQAPLLARLDPVVLREQLEAMMRVDLRKHWGIETVSGAGAGMAYGVNPGAFLSCVRDYVRITGDKAWALRHIEYLKSCLRPELTDYGDCQNILECVSTYEHTVASFNALAVQGMRFLADLLESPDASPGQNSRSKIQDLRRGADALAAKVLTLFEHGPWACVQPDGSRRIVKTILDFVYVGRAMTSDLPPEARKAMVTYFERDLQSADWLYALAPSDPDALTPRLPAFQTYRADHQATGSYDGWPARAASVLLRFGEREKAVKWLLRIQELTREGPFGQAHFIHGDGSTRKASFFNGNCYFESAGCGFATTILEDLVACQP